MRQRIKPQLSLGVVDIAAIQWDPCSRDDMPRWLRGLQYLYPNPQVREEVFTMGYAPAGDQREQADNL